jgi:spore photoproduct lyase
MKFPLEQIWVDEDAWDEPETRRILRKVPGVPVFVGDRVLPERRRIDLDPDPLLRGKRVLRLMKHKGAFVKPCPGTPEYVCCGLQILHIGQGCPMDCRYCALQFYFNRSTLEVFVNVEDMFAGLENHLSENAGTFHRVCTGEFTDSLALDPLTGIASRLVEIFSRYRNASLEIKTKTEYIEPLKDLRPGGNVVLSFSMNAQAISRTEERSAASLSSRLAAAAVAARLGYRIGFHFDPIVPMPGWQDAYAETIDRIYRSVDASAIVWISLGVLRFAPALKDVVLARFGPVPYFHDGFIRAADGKSRLYVDRRVEVYRHLTDRIRHHHPDARIYLCMESPHVWERALGIPMNSDDDLTAYLDRALPPQSDTPDRGNTGPS